MTEPENNNRPAKNAALSITKIIIYAVYIIAVFVEVMLLLRIVLLLFSANPTVPFVEWVYSVSGYFLAPFRGIFPARASELTGGYLDTSAIFAAVVYLIIVAVIQSVMRYLDRRR